MLHSKPVPLISETRDLAEAGALMSYGPDYHAEFRQAATYVDKILKGAKPGDPPSSNRRRLSWSSTSRLLGPSA